MTDDERMFAQLMKPSPDHPELEKPPPKAGYSRLARRERQKEQSETLESLLEDLSAAGYTSHSYRFTERELRWLRRFCMRLSEMLDRPVSHNTLIRLLFRLADGEWRSNPDNNKLRTLLDNHDK